MRKKGRSHRGAGDPPSFAAKLAAGLVASDEIAQRRLEVLAWLVKEKRLEIKGPSPSMKTARRTPPGMAVPYFHEKIGSILRDRLGDGVAFQGSTNESATAWLHNFESFSVFQSWDGTAGHDDLWVGKFEHRWNGEVPGVSESFRSPRPSKKNLSSLRQPKSPHRKMSRSQRSVPTRVPSADSWSPPPACWRLRRWRRQRAVCRCSPISARSQSA